jgi:hypothetical protein
MMQMRSARSPNVPHKPLARMTLSFFNTRSILISIKASEDFLYAIAPIHR